MSGCSIAEPRFLAWHPGRCADAPIAATGGILIAGLPPNEVQQFQLVLQRLAERVDAASFDVDWEDGPADAELRSWLETHSDSWGAAAAMARGRWQSADGEICATVLERCDAGWTCRQLGRPATEDPDERRARFLAWPLVYSRVLRGSSSASDQARERAHRPGVALVLSCRTDDTQWRALAHWSTRVLRRIPVEMQTNQIRRFLNDLADPQPLPDWPGVTGPNDLLVVPTMDSALVPDRTGT